MGRKLLALVVMALVSTGCVPSLQRLIGDDNAIEEPRLVGTWEAMSGPRWRRVAPGEEPDGERFWIEADGDRAYSMRYYDDADETSPERLKCRLARFGDGLYLELEADMDDREEALVPMHQVPASTFHRIEFSGDVLTCTSLDPDWLDEKLAAHAFRLPHVRIDDGVLLTASTKQLRRFMERHADDEGAFAPLDFTVP